MLGETVGNYRITGALSSGGMGAVYRAEHVLIGKAAAIKVLLPELSSNRDIVARFFNEARATTAIRHPGIVEVFDFGHHPSGRAYIVMELLDGESLASRLARRAASPSRSRSASRARSPARSPRRTPPGSSTAISSPTTSSSSGIRTSRAASAPSCSTSASRSSPPARAGRPEPGPAR